MRNACPWLRKFTVQHSDFPIRASMKIFKITQELEPSHCDRDIRTLNFASLADSSNVPSWFDHHCALGEEQRPFTPVLILTLTGPMALGMLFNPWSLSFPTCKNERDDTNMRQHFLKSFLNVKYCTKCFTVIYLMKPSYQVGDFKQCKLCRAFVLVSYCCVTSEHTFDNLPQCPFIIALICRQLSGKLSGVLCLGSLQAQIKVLASCALTWGLWKRTYFPVQIVGRFLFRGCSCQLEELTAPRCCRRPFYEGHSIFKPLTAQRISAVCASSLSEFLFYHQSEKFLCF